MLSNPPMCLCTCIEWLAEVYRTWERAVLFHNAQFQDLPEKYYLLMLCSISVLVDLADQLCIILGNQYHTYHTYIHTYIHTHIQLVTVARALLSRLIHFNSSFFSFLFLLPHPPGERREKPHSSFFSPPFSLLLLLLPFNLLISLLSSSSPPLPANSLSERSETGLQAIRRFWSIG